MRLARQKLALYNGILLLGAPFLALKKAIKFGRRGHAHEWDVARWKAPDPIVGQGKRVVFVALSWGEVGVLHEISQRLEAGSGELQIVWSIRDKTAQQMARERFPSRKIVPMPFDFGTATHCWLEAVRPDVLIVVEKFWWPNLVHGAKLRGAKVVLVNGRSRGRDKTRYKLLSPFQKWVLSAFDLLLFESEAQIERVRAVLPRGAKIEATGNVKFGFEAPPTPPDAPALEKWLSAANAPLLMAGSTAPVDEKWALEALEKVKTQTPCVLLMAPRRVERAGELAAHAESRGWKVSRRSQPVSSTPVSSADILILDTMGELSYAYQFGIAAYVGGSVEGRGHNIIEPLAHGIAASYGPNRGDFESVQRAAEALEVGFRLDSADELAGFWRRALADGAWREEIAARASQLIVQNSGALERMVALLGEEIAP